MKKYELMIAFMLLFATIECFAQNFNIVGKWKAEDNSKVMEILKDKEGFIYAKDIETGSIMIKELRYDSKSQKYTGKMKPTDKDIELNVSMTFINKDRIKMVAKKFIMSKSIYFVRQ